MLWLPNSVQLKAITRARRRRIRRGLARLLLFTLIFFGLTAATPPPESALLVQVEAVTQPDQFDFVDWVSQAVGDELARRWNPPPLPAAETEQTALMQTYLDQARRLDDLEALTLNRSTFNAAPEDSLTPSMAALKASQTQLTSQVESILARQVETILAQEGFSGIGGGVFPPVAFRLTEPPTGLVISPRDRIENQHFINLKPGLPLDRRVAIEAALDNRGDVSSYVTDIGGLGSYPTMVLNHADLIYLTDVIAHEWTHNYLFTFPTNIAWGYNTDPRLRTINETTASLVGQDISRKVITRFYPHWVDRLPPLNPDGQAQPPQPSPFDQAMRRIRQQVDLLLAEGKIEAAEAFMEAERLKLVKQGYHLRKLNQAYFAFHGSYALSPASPDPIGPQIRQLRAASPSLKAFLDRVGWLNSESDYQNWLVEMDRKP
jgi:hypothetical protein